MASSFLRCCLLFIAVCTADGYLCYTVSRCDFNSSELNGTEFISSHNYNRLELVRFSSSVGKFVGFTEFGVKLAERWNHNPGLLADMRAQKEAYCRPNIQTDYRCALTKTVKPYVRLHAVAPPVGEDPAMLVCSVYSFYPKQISVSWIIDGREVSSGVTSTEELADGDWFYQVHSHLEYRPGSGEKISCVVDHASLTQPLVTDWDPSMPDSDVKMAIVVASELILGLVLFLAGLVIYCWKTRYHSPSQLIQKRYSPGWILGPTECKAARGKFFTVYDRWI